MLKILNICYSSVVARAIRRYKWWNKGCFSKDLKHLKILKHFEHSHSVWESHLLLLNILKRTKPASYLSWSLLNYPFSDFQNTKFREKLHRFVGSLQWPGRCGSWGGPVVFSRGWKFFRIKFLPCWSSPQPGVSWVILVINDARTARDDWFAFGSGGHSTLRGHKIGRLQLNPAKSTTGVLATTR